MAGARLRMYVRRDRKFGQRVLISSHFSRARASAAILRLRDTWDHAVRGAPNISCRDLKRCSPISDFISANVSSPGLNSATL